MRSTGPSICRKFIKVALQVRVKTDMSLPSIAFGSETNLYKVTINPLPDDKILDWSKLKQIADDILKCLKNEK